MGKRIELCHILKIEDTKVIYDRIILMHGSLACCWLPSSLSLPGCMFLHTHKHMQDLKRKIWLRKLRNLRHPTVPWSARSTITKYHTLGGLNSRRLCLTTLEAGCPSSQHQRGLIPPEGFVLGLKMAAVLMPSNLVVFSSVCAPLVFPVCPDFLFL